MSINSLILLVTPPLLGVALGYALGGRLSALRSVSLSSVWLLWLAAAVQAGQYYIGPLRRPATLVVVFGLVFAWLAVNARHRPAAIRAAAAVIAFGALLNGLTIAANGRMPYSPVAAAAVGLRPGLETPKNEPADALTTLPFLGDTIPIAPLQKVVSPGDVLISGGTVALVAVAMRRRRTTKEANDAPDPDGDLAADRLRDVDAGVPEPAALHDRRADD